MLGQGEFAPGSALGTANEMFGPAAGYNAARDLDEGHPGMAAMAALPLIPGLGPEAKAAMETVDPAFLGAYEAEKAAAKMAREAALSRPSAVMKAPVEGLTEGAGMEDAAYQRALAKKKPLNSY
jgi:hypothetical protein